MFRKSTLIAVPAMAFALTLFASVNSTSQAFAKGGMGGPKGKSMGMNREHRGNWRNNFRYNRSWDRFYCGYPTYSCVEAPCVTPVVEPVVVAPVVEAPICTTCEPVYTSYGVSGSEWGFRHFSKDGRHRERPLERGRPMRGRK
jgi:hypothetical protein